MTDPKKRYEELLTRRERLATDLARHQAREDQRREERELIIKQLTAEGVDWEDPEAALAKISETLSQKARIAEQMLDELEAELAKVGTKAPPASKPVSPTPTTVAPAIPSTPSQDSSSVDDLELL